MKKKRNFIESITMADVNKEYLKKLEKMTNEQIKVEFMAHKIQNMVQCRLTNSDRFQRSYNTVIFEAKRRGLMRVK